MGSTAVAGLYDRLEETVLDRDQVGASKVYYDLVRAERPLAEIVRETTRIHAPYTHVPYHQRIDDGFVRFVNNDHCLLSSRASLALPDYLPGELRYLPMAQTIWYVPSGLDPWNQLLGKAPGHYGRRTYKPEPGAVVPRPTAHWADQEPLRLDGAFEERLNHWLTLVQCGEVNEAYRVFLGLFEETGRRHDLLGHMAFAGLIDVQDRMLLNRSYTTGHKSYRARATFEIGEAVGWEQAHDVLYAGVPDMAVGPRWHSAYEMACQIAWTMLAREEDQPESSLSPSPRQQPEAHLLANSQPLTPQEAHELVRALHEEADMAWINAITDLLLAGRDPKAIVDVIQTAAAQVILQVQHNSDFSMPHHGYEYTNTLRWFYDEVRPPAPHQAALRGRLVHQPVRAVGEAYAGQRRRRNRRAERFRTPVRRGSPAARGRRHHRAERIRRRRVGARVSRRRLRPQAPGAHAGACRGEGRQRSPQPGNRPVHDGGLPAQHGAGT